MARTVRQVAALSGVSIRTLCQEVPGKLNSNPESHPVLISLAEMNDLSRRQVFHTHIVQVANVLGSDAVLAKFGDVRNGESIRQRANLLEILRRDAVVTQLIYLFDGCRRVRCLNPLVKLRFDLMIAKTAYLPGALPGQSECP
jgi:hypothetical protein